MLVDALSQIWAFLGWLLRELPGYASLFTAAAAVAAWLALRANQRAFEGRLLSDLMNEYASEQMSGSMEAVRKWFDDPNVRPLDADRRRVSHYFQKIYRMYKAGFVTKRLVRTAIDAGQADFFLKMKSLEDDVRRERNLPIVIGDEPFKFYAGLHGPMRTPS